jgi:hypothetical protein
MLSRPFPKSAKIGFVGIAIVLIATALLLPMGAAEAKNDLGPKSSTANSPGKPIPSVQKKTKTLDNEAQYPWGKAVAGVQCRLRPMRSAWRSDDVPTLSLDIRNQGEKSIDFCRISEGHCEIEVDGRWYGPAELLLLGAKGWHLKPGMELKDAISVELTVSRALPKEGIDPPYAPGFAEKWAERLRLTPGKHSVRVRFRTDDWLVSYMKNQSSFSVLSNYVEVESFAADEEDALWGEPVEGLRIKLSSRKDWPLGQRPVFRMDIRNHSEKEFRLVLVPSSWELNVDGKTCRQSTFNYGEPPMLMIGPRQEHKGIIIPLDKEYGWQSGDSPLAFKPGKHTVSVTTRVNPVSDTRRTIRLASKPIEIQVSQRRITSPPWSKHVEGFQLRASAKKRRWRESEVPSFIADIRNMGPHSVMIPRIYNNGWEVEVDGKWYYCSIRNTLLPFPLTPYTQHDRIAIRMEPSWQGKPLWIAKTDKTVLDLQPGVHEIRIALPFGYKMIGGDDKSLRLTSDLFEIEILPTSGSGGVGAADPFVGWYLLGEDRLIPVLKRDGTYYSVCRGFEVPFKKCAEGLEWAVAGSSMMGTKIGAHGAYISIVDAQLGNFVESYVPGVKQELTRIDRPAWLLEAKGRRPRKNDDFVGWYVPIWFPYVKMEIRKDGEKYLGVYHELQEDGSWKAQGESMELAPLGDRLGFTGFDRDVRYRITYNKSLRRFELGGGTSPSERMPLARVSASWEMGYDVFGPNAMKVGIPTWH